MHYVTSFNVEVLSTKLEITLPKEEAIQWDSLERNEKPKDSGKPKYPSSSKKAVDFEKLQNDPNFEIEDELSKEEQVDAFFKQLYKDADDDTRRAMKKSFVQQLSE